MKRRGPPVGSGPGADKLRVARQRSHTRSDAGRATSTSPVPRRDSPVTCHACGKHVSRKGRRQIYCSRRCRQRAYWDRRVLAAISRTVTHDTGHSTTPRKSISNINDPQKAKSRPTDLFSTPVNLLGGGQWRWPNSTSLDARTLATILRAEIGARLAADANGSGHADVGLTSGPARSRTKATPWRPRNVP
jgi:hypothetical protein